MPKNSNSICPSCGKKVDASLKKCSFCGCDFTKEAPRKEPVEGELSPKEFLLVSAKREEENESLWPMIRTFLFILAAAAVVVVPIFFFPKLLVPVLIFDVLAIGVLAALYFWFQS